MAFLEEYDGCTVNQFDNIDLIHILLKRITRQDEISEEDRRIMTHLNECLFQLNLKKQNKEKSNSRLDEEW